MKAILAATLLLLSAASTLSAQNAPAPQPQPQPNNQNEVDSNPRFWQATFANGGHYLVKLDRISFVSKHEYIGNGAARVVEVTLGSDTSVVARFYWLEPVGKDTPIAAGNVIINRTEQITKDVGGRVSPSLAKIQVVKDYPNTTHSHTVEYALQNSAALNSLYSSLQSAVNTGRGRTWRETTGQ
ncbi:MAG TPA: hypothetical protein VLE43_17955 [Candidatus Saccharimonadia bacterium]|nr:hypothetical protein [Candidatus Saccharimonadia bacterium]